MEAAAAGSGRSATELGVGRSGSWWFAERMVCLTTEQVATVLSAPLGAHQYSKRGTTAELVKFRVGSSGTEAVCVGG